MRRSPSRLARAAILLASTAASAATGGGAGAARGDDPSLRAVRRETVLLRAQTALASAEPFYLRLDARGGRLALMLKGVVLDEYTVVSLEQAVPQVLFFERRPPGDWDLRSFSRGRLEPAREQDRIEVEAPNPANGASPTPPPIPRTAEETYSVPSSFRVAFAEGPSLEVRTTGGGGRNRPLLRRVVDRISLGLSDRAAALQRRAGDRVRLRVTLSPDDAAALYRSLPPDVSLVIVGLP
jgi:hypothetical protein